MEKVKFFASQMRNKLKGIHFLNKKSDRNNVNNSDNSARTHFKIAFFGSILSKLRQRKALEDQTRKDSEVSFVSHDDNKADVEVASNQSESSRIKRVGRIKQIPLVLFRHKFWIGGIAFSVLFVVICADAIYRGYFMNSSSESPSTPSQQMAISKTTSTQATHPTLISQSPSTNPSPSETTVLGTSDASSSDDTDYSNSTISPSVELSPIPTDAPEPTNTPDDTSSSDSSSSSNSNCTTSSGVPNSWYSDFYPTSPITASNGSATLTVNIRDCNISDVSSSSTLKISLSSGDSSTEINGQTLPVTISTQNGQASFTVTSQVSGTVGLTIQDTTDSFGITDTNNNNPSIVFNGSTTTPTPTSTPTQGISPTPGSSPAPTSVLTSTPNPTP